MLATGPFMGSVLSLVTALTYTWVGRVLATRRLAGEERRANHLFVLWWYSLAGLGFVTAGFGMAAAFGYTNLALHVALTNAELLAICLALWGLTYYLAYIFMGSDRLLAPSGFFYGACYLLLLYVVAWASPTGVALGRWSTQLTFARDLQSERWVGLVLMPILLPPLIGAIAYLTLFFRVDQPVQKYRIALVSGSFLGWFGSSILGSITGWSRLDWWPLVSSLVGLVAAFLVLLAFHPPTWVRRRLDPSQAEVPA
ncbi:MAG TPA: hypothetical protein VM286_06180 [Candidatus Thermoplasmatota archaeon]|nr:hypothetical protein [Candidatus Thermoplasmatota archaeon]